MSSHSQPVPAKKSQPRMTVPRFIARKGPEKRLTMLTAYDCQLAQILDEAGIDSILIGDTLGMVVQGRETTLSVSVEEIIYHAEIVARAVKRALVIADLPFMSYQVSPQQAVENAGRILKETGVAAVKLEGGLAQADTIRALSRADIPVMAHVGMRPQSVHQLGGMGRIQRDERRLLQDARAAEESGAFAIVLELIPQSLAKVITAELSVPTIGIGAGPHCDGQVLVSNDMLGFTAGFHPKFLRQFAQLGEQARTAAEAYINAVEHGEYPAEEHSHD